MNAQLSLVADETETASYLAVISAAASNPAVDVAKLEKLLDMQERIMAKHAEREFNAALSAAQSEIGRVEADASNPQTHSKYASYAALDRVLRPIYTNHGFALSFGTKPAAQDHVIVTCMVSHRAGHTQPYEIDMPADGKGAKGGDVMTKTHATGSAVTYGMRYLLKMIWNVAVGEDDDDGTTASAAPYERVTEDQALNLQALIDETATDKDKFCLYFQVKDLAHIAAKDYATAVKMLERKRSKT